MFCKNCGTEIGDKHYCPNCGAAQDAGTPNYGSTQNNGNAYSAPPIYNNTYNQYQTQPKSDMSVGDWIITLILTIIPVVNLICLIVWAVSSSPNKVSRKNWAIAQLIFVVIAIILVFIIFFVVGVNLTTKS